MSQVFQRLLTILIVKTLNAFCRAELAGAAAKAAINFNLAIIRCLVTEIL